VTVEQVPSSGAGGRVADVIGSELALRQAFGPVLRSDA
jgi:hypothetical protein